MHKAISNALRKFKAEPNAAANHYARYVGIDERGLEGDTPLYDAPTEFWDAVPSEHLPTLCHFAVEGKRKRDQGLSTETWEIRPCFTLKVGLEGDPWVMVEAYSGELPIDGFIGLELHPDTTEDQAQAVRETLSKHVRFVTYCADNESPLGRGEAYTLLTGVVNG